jgi:hypothetical protein
MRKNYDAPSLPEHCYTVLPSSGQLIEVRRGETGYYPCAYSTGDRAYNKVLADYFNAHEGITKAQAAAMLTGSLFGWDTPGADPSQYDLDGEPVRPGERKPLPRSPQYLYEQSKLLREEYSPGTKVILDKAVSDPYYDAPAGLTGIVQSVDDAGQLLCQWENGLLFRLVPGTDYFHKEAVQELELPDEEEDLEL